jgi:hypothetical protein
VERIAWKQDNRAADPHKTMNLFGWIRRTRPRVDHPREQWRAAWTAAVEGTDAHDAELRRRLETFTPIDEDVEVELEMLEALGQLRSAQRLAATGSLPAVETRHRVIGAERCHFSAPASLPADQGQTSGRVLVTPLRVVFVGAGRTSAASWHAVHEVVRMERDVLLLRTDHAPAAHFRFNTYGDAVVCAFLARHLKGARGRLSRS